MSFDRCRTCRYVVYCTFPHNRIITECDEYEDMDVAPAYEWDLNELRDLKSERQESCEE